MIELKQLQKNEYDNYVRNHKMKSHFLQSYAWGEFAKAKKNLQPHYLGLVEDDKILGATLLLQKKLPLGYSYFYAPRGFVIDYTDADLIQQTTKKVVKYIKKKKGIFLKIDPDIIMNEYSYLDEKKDLPYDPKIIFKNIKKAGFKHIGFTQNFETMQPRFSFRIDLEQSLEDIEDHFSKTTSQRINKAQKLGTDVVIGTEDDIDEFYHLMTITESRKDFVSYNKDYYSELYRIFNEDNKATLFLGKINIEKVIKNLKEKEKSINNQISILPIDNLSKSAKNKYNELNKQKENIINDIKKFEKIKEEYQNEITLNAHMIIEYGDKAWVLYAGNHDILTDTYSNYNTYYEHLKYCKERGLKVYDQFGTIGDLRASNPCFGLHEFKKKFGGDYVEFLGEFDYITNHLMYFVFNKLVPLYRKVVKKKAKKALKKELNK